MNVRFLCCFAIGLASLSAHAGAALAQTPLPAFDVVSVKVNKLAGQPPYVGRPTPVRSEFECSSGGRFVSKGYILSRPIMFAYDVTSYDVSGLPQWALPGSGDAFYDIEARTESKIDTEQCRLMVQALLADRFGLKVHREKKEVPVYALVVGKNGIRMTEVPESEPGRGGSINGVRMAPDGGVANGWSMAQLAQAVSLTTMMVNRRRVVDRTGLKGIYEFSLVYDQFPDLRTIGRGGAFDRPDLSSALQAQLGLRLEARKELFDTVVIDHIEKPSAN